MKLDIDLLIVSYYYYFMKKEYAVLISLLFCLFIWSDADKFRMYEETNDTIENLESMADTILVPDSPQYKKGYEDGTVFAEKQWNKLGIWEKLKVKLGMKAYDFPEHIYKRGINYERGFISGHNDKAFMPSGMVFLLYYLGTPFLSLIIMGIIYGLASLFSILI